MEFAKHLAAAVDMSGNMARFALAEGDGGRIICRTRKPMRQREAAALADFIFESLSCAQHDIREINAWTIGSGPGSFTGMRLAAALVAGLSRKNGVLVRCVPTAVAIAGTPGPFPENRNVAALFDGRNKEIIAFEMRSNGNELIPTGKSCVLNAMQAKEYFKNHEDFTFVAQAYELDPILRLVPEENEIKVVEHFDPALLITAQYQPYDGNFNNLEYIRPAVFPPKK